MFGAGVRYETGRMDDALKIDQFPGESIQQKITDRQGTSYDLLNVHSFTESWIEQECDALLRLLLFGPGQRFLRQPHLRSRTMMSATCRMLRMVSAITA